MIPAEDISIHDPQGQEDAAGCHIYNGSEVQGGADEGI